MDRLLLQGWEALRSTLRLLSLLTVLSGIATAGGPRVNFDVAQVVSCREVEAPECLKERLNSPVIEVVFDVSARLIEGNESELKSITYEITSPGKQLTFVGFAPMTLLASEAADGVITVEEHETPAQLNFEYAGSQAKLQAPLRTPVDKKVTTKKLAPKKLLISSGTFDRAHGVYFTFYRSQFDSMQRMQSLICYVEADASFRADYVHLLCRTEAEHRDAEFDGKSSAKAGTSQFQVGIYREGDVEARAAAEDLANCQQQLNRATLAYRRSLVVKPRESASPVEALMHLVTGEPKQAKRGREVTVFKPVTGAETESRLQYLEARQAIETAQRNLRSLNQMAGPMR